MQIDFSKLEAEIQEKGTFEQLENGAVLIAEENMRGRGITKGFIEISAGSWHEAPEDWGVMHFVEHMTFEGTTNTSLEERAAINRKTGQANYAGTDFPDIRYSVTSRGDGHLFSHVFPNAFSQTIDTIANPTLTQQSFEKQKAIILRELVEREHARKNPNSRNLVERLRAHLLRSNPHLLRDRTTRLGTRETLDAMTLDKIKDYHRRFFVGSNTIAYIQGDFIGGVLDSAKNSLLSLVPGVRAPLIKETPEPQFQGEERIEIDSLGQDDALVAAVYHIPSWHSIQSPKITFLKYILGGEEHGIAFQEIREKRQLSYGPDVILFGNDKTRYLLFGFTVNKNRLDEALEAIDISIEKVKKGDFHSELLEAYRLSNLPSQIFQFSQPGWIGRVLTQRHEKERYGFETTSLERLQVGLNLTNQDAIDMANQYLGKNRLIVTSK